MNRPAVVLVVDDTAANVRLLGRTAAETHQMRRHTVISSRPTTAAIESLYDDAGRGWRDRDLVDDFAAIAPCLHAECQADLNMEVMC